MKRTSWTLLGALAVLLIGMGIVVYNWVNHPMNQSLKLTTPTLAISQSVSTIKATPKIVQPTSTHTATPQDQALAQVVATPTATPTIIPTDVPKICGNTGKMNLLVIGLTLHTDEEQMGADAIRLVTLDFDQPSVTILSLPAWLWVDTLVLADMGLEEAQLTAVYLEIFERVQSESLRFRHHVATQAVAQTILDNFGFAPDHFVTVDEQAFINYVDLLGGIQVDLPEAVDGTAEEYGFYPAGQQTLNGTRALNFARLFHPSEVEEQDVWGNMDRQKQVVRGVLDATLKPQNLTKIPSLMNEVMRTVLTDLSLGQVLDLACMMEEVGENVRILGITEDMVYQDEAGRMIPDSQAMQEQILQMENGK